MTAADEPQTPEHTWDNATPLLYSLAYCSRAAPTVDDSTVAQIVAKAAPYNSTQQITGMLVFGSGIFFQWLEGPRAQVKQLMALIQADPRHHSVVQLTEAEEVRERMFPDWGMERVGSDDIRVVLVDAMDSAEDPLQAKALAALLRELDGGQLRNLAAV